MITRGIVEELVTPYQVKVRVPLFDRVAMSPLSTSNNSLNTATICTLPNCSMNLQVGDVVFIGFEDNTLYKAVVLGVLARESALNTHPSLSVDAIEISGDFRLGDVTSSDIMKLAHLRDNVQQQIDFLQQQLDLLSNQINDKLGG